MCVTMWREKTWVKGDACCWDCVSSFFGKADSQRHWTIARDRRKLILFLLFPQVDLHYLPAHLRINGENVSLRYLYAGEEKRGDGLGERTRSAGCFGSVRPGGAQPERRTRLSGLNGLGGKGVEREQISPNDFYPVQM